MIFDDEAQSRFIWRVLMVSIIFWAGTGAIVTYLHPMWPTGREAWINFALICIVNEFLGVKIFQLVSPTEVWTRLAASLVAANLGFLIAYSLLLLEALWPRIFMTRDYLWILRGELVFFLSWSVVELLLIRGKSDDLRPKLTASLTVLALASVAALAYRTGGFSWVHLNEWRDRTHDWITSW